jgi:hypothetical protein
VSLSRRIARLEGVAEKCIAPVVCVAQKTAVGVFVSIKGKRHTSLPGESEEAFCARISDARVLVVGEVDGRL